MLSPGHTDTHNPLTSKEGWGEFVAQAITPPQLLAPAALQKLTAHQRERYDAAREDYHAQLVVVSTPTIRHVTSAGRKRILLNKNQHSARRGLIVSGRAGTGKTTAITQLGKNYEQLTRRRQPLPPTALPVVYVTVPPAATPKSSPSSSLGSSGCPCPPGSARSR